MASDEDFGLELLFHVPIVFCFIVFGGFENFVIIFMLQRKKSLQSGQKFMLFLAYIDLIACLYCVPMIPCYIYLYGRSPSMSLLATMLYRVPYSTLILAYLAVSVFMAVDRVRATTKPFSYKPPKIRSFLWILAFVAVFQTSLILGMVGVLPREIVPIQGSLPGITALAICVPCYVWVVIKLRKQHNKVAVPAATAAPRNQAPSPRVGQRPPVPEQREVTQEVETSAQESRTNQEGHNKPGVSGIRTTAERGKEPSPNSDRQAMSKKEKELERRMLKLCLAITCLFGISFTSLSARVGLGLPYHFDYVYSLNHVGNPIIYCLVSKAYYRDVKETVKVIFSAIQRKFAC